MIIFGNGSSVTGVHSKDGIKSRENTQGYTQSIPSSTSSNSAPHDQLMLNTIHLFKGVGNFLKSSLIFSMQA